jgi:hypothetical protein
LPAYCSHVKQHAKKRIARAYVPGFLVSETLRRLDSPLAQQGMQKIDMPIIAIRSSQGAASFTMAMCTMTITHAIRPPGRHSRIR